MEQWKVCSFKKHLPLELCMWRFTSLSGRSTRRAIGGPILTWTVHPTVCSWKKIRSPVFLHTTVSGTTISRKITLSWRLLIWYYLQITILAKRDESLSVFRTRYLRNMLWTNTKEFPIKTWLIQPFIVSLSVTMVWRQTILE